MGGPGKEKAMERDGPEAMVNVSSAVCATEGCALLENLGVLQ